MAMSSSNKIKSREEIIEIADRLRAAGYSIVTTNGAFDLLHIGHLKMLQEAKSLGDVLIVGVNSDRSIRRFKGPNRPINSERDRAEMLAALACTDYVTIFDELTPVPLLDAIKPRYHVNSPEHGYACIEKEVVLRHGGEIYISRLVEGLSTTTLIEKILQAYARPAPRAIFLDTGDLLKPECREAEERSRRAVENGETAYPSPLSRFSAPWSSVLDEKVLQVLSQFRQAGYRLILLANHPEVAMGLRTEEELEERYGEVRRFLKALGIELDGIYWCPHHPRGKIGAYRRECACRKPLPGLLEQAVSDLNINLARSFVVGRKQEDILMGREINCKTILVEDASFQADPNFPVGPNFRVGSFEEVLERVSPEVRK